MFMQKLVIFGTGKVADALHRYIAYDRAYEVVGFTSDAAYLPPDGQFHQLKTVAFEHVEEVFPPERCAMLIAVGYQELNALRAARFDEARSKGYQLPGYVNSRAYTGDWLELGANCIILDHVSIEPGAKLGDDVVIFSNVTVGHHASVGDHCWLAANAVLGGHASVGARSFVGLGATVGHEAALGDETFLGAGAVVTRCSGNGGVFIDRDTNLYRLDSKRFLQISKMQ
jgi:sugar O-acyltransferase (sialic acid O-acetyltransferase NeuD family)